MFLQLLTGLSLLEIVLGASCGPLSYGGSSGTVSSPGSASYSSNLYCTYDIKVSDRKGIKLTWTKFDVKGKMPLCSDDYVEIFIGCDRHSIGKYCSENGYTPFDVYSPDNCLRLRFKSDSSGSGKGFVASYSTFSEDSRYLSSSCYGESGLTLTSTSGVIGSYGWPGSYPSLRDCYWKIEVGSRRSIKIAFMDFDLDIWCDDDKVKVKGGSDYQSYDSSSTIKSSRCGLKTPFSFTSTKERIWIRFKSSLQFSSSYRGFVAGYVMYDSSASSSSGSRISAVAVGIIIPLIILIVCAVVIYKFVYRRRLIARQAATAQVLTPQPQQAVVHHPPPAPQPGYAPPPPAGYPAPTPAGYAPPPTGYAPSPQPGYAPPPYSQVVGSAPYPQQDKSGAYPPAPQGGAPPYPPGQPGGAPPYPPGQPGGLPGPYPPEQSGGPAPYPTAPPGGAAPYPTAPPGDAPYPQK